MQRRQRIELIAHAKFAHHERHVKGTPAPAFHRHGRCALLRERRLLLATLVISVVAHHIQVERETVALSADAGIHAPVVGACRCVHAAAQFPNLLCEVLFLLRGYVQNSAHALNIIARSGIGNNLYALHAACRHVAEDLRRIARYHRVEPSVYIHLELARTVHRDIVLAVNRNHRHFAQHLQHRLRLGIYIILNLIGHLVGLHAHHGHMRHHGHLVEACLCINPRKRVGNLKGRIILCLGTCRNSRSKRNAQTE